MMTSRRRGALLPGLTALVFLLSICTAAAVDSENTYQGNDFSSQYPDGTLTMHGTDRNGNPAPTTADELDSIRQHLNFLSYLVCSIIGMILFYYSMPGFLFKVSRR